MSDVKKYIAEQFKIAKSDYNLARSDEERFAAFRDMRKLKLLAAEKFGIEFAYSLDNL
ncbi:hypothetical protein [Jeotgalibaca porci]|uniref:hypothetical protein n=1 Tax=Jeotgalibaca porci TaxID=1868793 RepID=UPI0035A1B860